jgi:hypothetical protein
MAFALCLSAFLLAAACGALGSAISKHKNREPVEGFLLGFLLSVIGLVVAAVLPAKPAVVPPVQDLV